MVLTNYPYTDLSTLAMTQFTFVADPTRAPTAAATGITRLRFLSCLLWHNLEL